MNIIHFALFILSYIEANLRTLKQQVYLIASLLLFVNTSNSQILFQLGLAGQPRRSAITNIRNLPKRGVFRHKKKVKVYRLKQKYMFNQVFFFSLVFKPYFLWFTAEGSVVCYGSWRGELQFSPYFFFNPLMELKSLNLFLLIL